jgi:hypothetical protein
MVANLQRLLAKLSLIAYGLCWLEKNLLGKNQYVMQGLLLIAGNGI